MSILKQLQSIQQAQTLDETTQLTKRHVLADAPLEFRLQYLAAVAMLTAPEREPCERERHALKHLATSLGLEPNEADEQLNGRTQLSNDDILTLFAALREQKASWNYLADLAWLHSIDGQADENESAAFSEAMHFLGLDTETTECRQALQLPALMRAVQTADDEGFVALRYRSTWPTILDAVLTATTQKMLPVLEKNAADLIFS